MMVREFLGDRDISARRVGEVCLQEAWREGLPGLHSVPGHCENISKEHKNDSSLAKKAKIFSAIVWIITKDNDSSPLNPVLSFELIA